jgi:hypothetical protein
MDVSQLPYSASTTQFIQCKTLNIEIIMNRGFGGIRNEKVIAW